MKKRKNKFTYPDDGLCHWCKENKVIEPHSFAFLECGALLMDRTDDSGGPSQDMDAYFGIGWHGAHPEDGGIGNHPNIFTTIDIAENVTGGQIDFYFCSTHCLREFLNASVDELEKRIKSEEK